MKFLSQRDPLWSGKKMGASKLTLGRMGCTTTSISMLSDYFGCYMSPAEIASNIHNYTKDGLIIWQNLSFFKMQFVRRTHGRDDAMIQTALNDPNQAVILQVSNGAHWVVCYSKRMIVNDYWCIDPWTGTKEKVIGKYKNITGAAFFKRV